MRSTVASLFVLCLMSWVSPWARCELPRKHSIRVAVYNDLGVSRSAEDTIRTISAGGSFQVAGIKAEAVRSGGLAGFDVLVMPGGVAYKQATTLGPKGREEIRRFVLDGGGYVGICAGAYLACSCFSWSLGILDARTVDGEHWARGTADLGIELSAEGMRIFETGRARLTIQYRQGPLLAPGGEGAIPDYRELAWFTGEVALNGAPRGVMIGTTAIAAAEFGQGRVICFSPHPELTPGLGFMLHRGIAWSGQRAAANDRSFSSGRV